MQTGPALLAANMSDFPEIQSKHSLVAKFVTPELWAKLSGHKTATSGFTLAQAIACAVQFDDQHCGIYAGDEDSYKAHMPRSGLVSRELKCANFPQPWVTRVWWQIEISKFLAFSSTYIFTLQQLMENPVKI